MILDGTLVANQLLEELKKEVVSLTKIYNIIPTLLIIQVGDLAASNSYIKSKLKKGSEIGIKVLVNKYPIDIDVNTLVYELAKANNDKSIHGIIIQQPLPIHLDIKHLMNYLDTKKDADGFGVFNAGKLFLGEQGIRPATPYGILSILRHYMINPQGMNAVVIGRSNIVGMPIAKMLLDLNATVTICHSKTKNIKSYTKRADLIIVAIGKPLFLTSDMVKKNVIIIDVGINRVNEKLVGDCDFEALVTKAKYISPVPGGVGPLTVVSLLQNTVSLYKKQMLTNLA